MEATRPWRRRSVVARADIAMVVVLRSVRVPPVTAPSRVNCPNALARPCVEAREGAAEHSIGTAIAKEDDTF